MKRKSPAAHAFTLVEMLVVIGIIVILAGLLFPTFGAVKNMALKTQAANEEQQVVTAAKAYFTDYGKYPITDVQAAGGQGSGTTTGQDTVFGDPGGTYSNDKLFNVLRGLPHDAAGAANGTAYTYNPRQQVYLEVKDAKDKANPVGGIVPATATGTARNSIGQWMDPWGTPYIIFVDANYDNAIDFFGIYSNSTTDNPVPRVGVGVASFGKDKKPGKTDSSNPSGNKIYAPPADDVVSWR